MKSILSFLPGFLLLAFFCVSPQAYAQRFTSSGPSQIDQKTDTLDGGNGALSYEALKAGNLDKARAYLDEANPGDPYAMFVRAALTQDAVTAADMYKEIIAENEGTPIAREALLQLYKYHYAAGDYASAHRDYVELNKFSMPSPVSDPLGLRDSLQAVPSSQVQSSPPVAPVDTSVTVQSAVYLVQLGVFSTVDNARRFVQQLKAHGINGKMFTKDDGGRTLYGVSAGSFSSRAAADGLAGDLKSRSIDCIVVQR